MALTTGSDSCECGHEGCTGWRPEHVVKAEVLRKAAVGVTAYTTTTAARDWLNACADTIDPPRPAECGHTLALLADPGEWWKQGTCVSRPGHEGEHLYRVTSGGFEAKP